MSRKMNKIDPSTLVRLSDVEKALGVPRSTLVYRTLTGWIRPYQYGPVKLYDLEQIRTVLKSADYKPRKQAVA